MMFNKNVLAGALALSLLPVAGLVHADDAASSVEIQFNGSVKAPTCTINDSNTDHSVNLAEINQAKVAALTTGQATAEDQQRFHLSVNCAEKASADDLTMTIDGHTDGSTPTILTNTSTDADSAKGVGFELFSEQDLATPLQVNGGVVPSADYIDRLNQGTESINFVVEYAKQDATVSAGTVTSNATFAFTYK
ncbi:fimbrial protein [Rahnella sp. PCH160]|uniref:fimbrial protein n=1 Tax=Rahnella sp. PCH160 TaxID=3447928 RepID=UPI0039FC502B